MKFANQSFISSTFWSERIGFVAGISTLDEMKKIKSWNIIKKKGKKIKELLNIEANRNNLKIKFSGLDGLVKFDILNAKKNYLKIIISEMLKKNFLSTNAIYVSVAHTDILINKYIKEIGKVFKKISKK